jgi:predicted RNA-binding Zn ribbon-like protein
MPARPLASTKHPRPGPQDPASQEWTDGFLFVGNHLALDFLNTKLVLPDGPKELLPDTDALVRWLIASGLLEPDKVARKRKMLARKWSSAPQAEAFLKRLITFRERLRAEVIRLENGSEVSSAFAAEVNSLLEQHPSVIALRRKGEKLERELAFEPSVPADIWAPISMAVGELLSDVPPRRVRRCGACMVHYYDTSRKGSRRWCSMNICGNKIKVAAYQRRSRAAEEQDR